MKRMIAILLVGVFWLWNWGQEGSETLNLSAFALEDSSSVANPACDIYRVIPDSVYTVLSELEFGHFEPGIILIRLKEEDEISAAIFAASQTKEAITGVASFDSISQKYGLICLLPGTGEWSIWYKRDFRLLFSLDLDYVSALRAYNDLPYVEFAYLSTIYILPDEVPDSISAILDHSWGRIKTYRRKGEEDP